jgi:hypothetical protein
LRRIFADNRSYLRFNVQGLTGSIAMQPCGYANSNSSPGLSVRVSRNAGVESPPVQQSSGRRSWLVKRGEYRHRTTIDVTSYITGNGVSNFALTTPSNTAISLASRESGANAPQLIIETSDGSTLTPTFTPTATFTPSPTSTFTPTNTAGPSPTPTNTLIINTFTFNPVADAYVIQAAQRRIMVR